MMTSVKGKAYPTEGVRSSQSGGIIAAYVDENNPQTLFVAVASVFSSAEKNNFSLGHQDFSTASEEEWKRHSSSFSSVRYNDDRRKGVEDGRLVSEEGVVLSIYRSFLPFSKAPYHTPEEEEVGNHDVFGRHFHSATFSPCDSSHLLLLQRIPLPFTKRLLGRSSFPSSIAAASTSGILHSDAAYPSASSVNGAEQAPSISHSVIVKEEGEKCVRDDLQQSYCPATHQMEDALPKNEFMRKSRKDEEEDKASLEVDKLLWISPSILGVLNRKGELCIAQTGVIPFHQITRKDPSNSRNEKEMECAEGRERVLSSSFLVFPVMSQVHDFTGCSIPALPLVQSCERHLVKRETEKGSHPHIATGTPHPSGDDKNSGVDAVFVLERNKGMKACLTYYWRAQKGIVTDGIDNREKVHCSNMENGAGKFLKDETLEEYERVETKVMHFPEERYHCLSVTVCHPSCTLCTPRRKETKEEERTTLAGIDVRSPLGPSSTEQGYLLLAGCSSQSTIVITTRSLKNFSLLSKREIFLGPLYRMWSISISLHAILGAENTPTTVTHASDGGDRLWIAVVASCTVKRRSDPYKSAEEGSPSNGDGMESLDSSHSDAPLLPTLPSPSSSPSPLPFTLKGKDGRPLMVDVKTSVEEILNTPLPLNPCWRSSSSSSSLSSSSSSLTNSTSVLALEDAKGAVSPLSTGDHHPPFHPPHHPLPYASEKCSASPFSSLSLCVMPPDILHGEGVVCWMEWDLLSYSLLTPRQEFPIPPSPLVSHSAQGKREEGGNAPRMRGDDAVSSSFSATPSRTAASTRRATAWGAPWTVRLLPRFRVQPATRESEKGNPFPPPKGWEAHLVIFDGTSDGVATLVVPFQPEQHSSCASSFLSSRTVASSRQEADDGTLPLPHVHWEPMRVMPRTPCGSDRVPNNGPLSLDALESKKVILGVDEVHVACVPTPYASSSPSLSSSHVKGRVGGGAPTASHEETPSGKEGVVGLRKVYRILLTGYANRPACASPDSLQGCHGMDKDTNGGGGSAAAHEKGNFAASFLGLQIWETTGTIALSEKKEDRVRAVKESTPAISRRSLPPSGASSSLLAPSCDSSLPRNTLSAPSLTWAPKMDAAKRTLVVSEKQKPASPSGLWHSLWEAFIAFSSSTEVHAPPPPAHHFSGPPSRDLSRSPSHALRLSHEARVAGNALREILRTRFVGSTTSQMNPMECSIGSSTVLQKDPSVHSTDNASSSEAVPSSPLEALWDSSTSPSSRASYHTTVAGQVIMWMDVWEKMVPNTDEESRMVLLQLGKSLWNSLLDHA